MKNFVFLVAMLPLIGCATAGVNYNPYAFHQIESGMTRDEVIRIVGKQPTHQYITSTNEKTTTMLQWVFVNIGLAVGHSRALTITFDENNRAINFTKSDNSSQVSQ